MNDEWAGPSPLRFWELLDPAQRAAVRRAATPHDHPAGTVLLQEGDRSESALILVAGRVKVVSTGLTGYRGLLAIRVPGDIVGELAAVDGNPRSATVIAVDSVRVLRLPARAFTALLADEPGVASAALKVVVSRLRMANLRRVQYGETTVAQRVDTVLAEMASEHGTFAHDGIAITLPLGQEDLAGLVAGSRETVVRALRCLRDSGIISTGRQRITILQPEALSGHVIGSDRL